VLFIDCQPGTVQHLKTSNAQTITDSPAVTNCARVLTRRAQEENLKAGGALFRNHIIHLLTNIWSTAFSSRTLPRLIVSHHEISEGSSYPVSSGPSSIFFPFLSYLSTPAIQDIQEITPPSCAN